MRRHCTKKEISQLWKGYVSNTIPAGLTDSELVGSVDGPSRAAVVI